MVARAHCQTIGLAHNGADNYLDRKIQIPHDVSQHCNLSGIFLSEKCKIRLHDMEKLGHDGRHAAKMSGPGSTIEALANARNLDECRRTVRVHGIRSRSEDQVHTFCFEHPAILFERAGIPVEVLIGRKLCRIDEDGSHGYATPPARGLYQGKMSGVQRAHCRDETYGTVPTQVAQSGSYFCECRI